MPEPPVPPKFRRPISPAGLSRPPGSSPSRATPSDGSRYAELHCRTNFSFLEGASHPDELVDQAASIGLTALAITDRNSVAGVVRAHVAAKGAGLKLVIGAEITPHDSASVLLWAMHREGYASLCRLITLGRRQAPKGECRLSFNDVAAHSNGLLAGVLLPPAKLESASQELFRWREVFDDRCYGVVELHQGPQDEWILEEWRRGCREAGVSPIAANDVHYHAPERQCLQEVLTAVRHGCTVADLGVHRFSNGERRIKSAHDMRTLFAAAPELVDRTQEVADRCAFVLDELRYEYPAELCPSGETLSSYLSRLTWAGAADRYPGGIPDKVRQLLHRELKLIEELRYEAYFLTVWDLVRFARSRHILCQGRGSAANSAVCFCLGVTSVNPDQIDVLFERFISRERDEAPDIDVDFEHERREEVIQYVYEKYGRDRAGMTATVITYRTRSAVRDIGKALGLSLDRVDALAKILDHINDPSQVAERFRMTGFDPESMIGRQLIGLWQEIRGFPRHLSQHTGGMVLTRRPLCDLVPLENATMPGRTVLQWDKDDLDAIGILKVDCLALGMLTAIRRGLDLLQRYKQIPLTLATIPSEDPAVYEMIQRADTIGVFQIESRAQMSMLPRLKPKAFYDLVIEVAIVRPGPIQGDMVHPYLRRRNELERVTCPSKELEQVLSRTMGVPLFQEQAMRIVMIAGGFTGDEADQFRKAMGAWRKTGMIEKFRQKLLNGMKVRGYTEQFAEQIFNQIKGFGEYGFPESHAASFALLVYASAWIKRHHPDIFLAALLNSQPLGFYSPGQLIADARKHDVEVRPADINHSNWDCTLEPASGGLWAVRLGWRVMKGLGQDIATRMTEKRTDGDYASWSDFVRRTRFRSSTLIRLADADAFQSIGLSRRQALWMALPEREETPLFESLDDDPVAPLRKMTSEQSVTADYRAGGFSLRDHPMLFLRRWLSERGVVKASDLETLEIDRRYHVAGLVMLRQRPGTAKGITFMTLEDESAAANLIVHLKTWEKFYRVARGATAIIARGILQRANGSIHLIVDHLADLSGQLSQIASRSRDFH